MALRNRTRENKTESKESSPITNDHNTRVLEQFIQSTLVISASLIWTNRFSRSEKSGPWFQRGNLTTANKILLKKEKLLLRSNFSSFPKYFQYISNYTSQITYSFVICGYSIYLFFSILQWYVEVWISRSISDSSFDFEVTRVDCICRLKTYLLGYITLF